MRFQKLLLCSIFIAFFYILNFSAVGQDTTKTLLPLPKGKISSDDFKLPLNFLTYPIEALEYGIQGKVYCSVFVDSTCSITRRKIIRSLHHSCDSVALSAFDYLETDLKNRYSEKCDSSSFIIPIIFKLE